SRPGARVAVERALQGLPAAPDSRLGIQFLPLMPQPEYDHLLWSCDLNFVRGEDSLVRALWAGRPFVWQIYPQDDGAHHAKLDAFLDWLDAPPQLRAFHHHWNGVPGTPPAALPATLADWAETAGLARGRALAGPELAAELSRFVHGTR
ncbi:elongation factor P maturation arginine rhamnosyltransferase EarP, partial [Ramlibacter sp.]|uniref:elongation factor P maturation arginine rhamnosyltransferase EarP n=1 Tax=Ramlibacter sp. TaxID=1917967 RepID=UPI00180798D8